MAGSRKSGKTLAWGRTRYIGFLQKFDGHSKRFESHKLKVGHA